MAEPPTAPLYRGGNLKAMTAWTQLGFTLSRRFPDRMHAVNRIAGSVQRDPRLRKRGAR